jgi:hypothetical protein
MKKILFLAFVGIFLLSINSVNAGNLVCGSGSIGTCPTVNTACAGVNATCSYTNCTCVVTTSQAIDNNAVYYFGGLTIASGVTVSSTGAAGGNYGVDGTSGFGAASGGTGGTGGTSGGVGGSYAGGGGGGYNARAGGSYAGGGGGGYYDPAYSGGAGGAAGGIVKIYANNINITGTINVSGAAGAAAGGGTHYGGGGGGGGGNIFLYGNSIYITGALIANGGAGGADPAHANCGGGGGGGGLIYIAYACSYTPGTYSVNGGAGGSTGGGSGTSGAISVVGLNSPYSYNQALNITLKDQNNVAISGATVYYYEAGNTSNIVCNSTTDSNGFFSLGFDESGLKKLYDINVTTTSNYQQNIWYKAARTPGNISMYGNRKWVPESTLPASKLFTAGHIVPVEIHIFAPWTSYEVANISLEDSVPSTARIASNILFEKFNSTGRYVCDVLPDNSTYYFVDKTECSFLNYLNITAKEWLRVTYRTRIEGPEAYTTIGEQKTYTLPTAYLRFDVVT